jgi:hypothetical protein
MCAIEMNFLKCVQDGESVPFTVCNGLDLPTILKLELDWGAEKAKIFAQLIEDHPEVLEDQERFREVMDEYQLSDHHWNWITKARHLGTQEYFWFFLIAEDKAQAACIIKHPKHSRIDNAGIFYIDYLAVAYWNRDREKYIRRFKGVGTALIMHAVKYSIEVLGYRPGFSLHSLPSAEGYYRQLKMAEYDKDPDYHDLIYFEAPEPIALSLAEGAVQ